MSDLILCQNETTTIHVTPKGMGYTITVQCSNHPYQYSEWAEDVGTPNFYTGLYARANSSFLLQQWRENVYVEKMEQRREAIRERMSEPYWYRSFPASEYWLWRSVVRSLLTADEITRFAYSMFAWRAFTEHNQHWFADAGLKYPANVDEITAMAYEAAGLRVPCAKEPDWEQMERDAIRDHNALVLDIRSGEF